MAKAQIDLMGVGGTVVNVEEITLSAGGTITRNFPNLKNLLLSLSYSNGSETLVMENGTVTKLIIAGTSTTPTKANSVIWVSYANGVITFESNSGSSRTFQVLYN